MVTKLKENAENIYILEMHGFEGEKSIKYG